LLLFILANYTLLITPSLDILVAIYCQYINMYRLDLLLVLPTTSTNLRVKSPGTEFGWSLNDPIIPAPPILLLSLLLMLQRVLVFIA